jgi:ABC-type uncharacterized transport system permease subunit
LKAYLASLQVSFLTALIGGVFGFFVAYAVTIGNAPRWMRNVIMTFSGWQPTLAVCRWPLPLSPPWGAPDLSPPC